MANRKGQEQGNRSPRQFRTGIDIPYFKGLNRDYDAGAISDTELQDAINIRLIGGRIDCRGGQEKLNETPLDGCVWSIDDLPMPTVGLFLAHIDNATYSLDRYNLDLSPNYQGAYPAASLPNLDQHQPFGSAGKPRQVLVVWRNKLLAADTTNGTIYEVVLPKEGTLGDIALRPLVSVPQISSMIAVPEGGESILYVGSTSNNEVYRYDGTWLSTDGAIGFNSERMIVGRFHDLLYIFGTQYALVRQPGAPLVNGIPAPGTYASLTMAAGVTTFRPSAMCEFGQELVIAGLDAAITPGIGTPGPGCLLIYDGSTMTLARQPNDGGGVGVYRPARGISDVFFWNGKVWYLWREFGTDPNTWIGSYDGSAWNDTVASLGTTQTGSANTGDLLTANGLLYATTIRDETAPGLTNSSVLLSSPDGATWTLVEDITDFSGASDATVPAQMVVFG